MIKLKKLLKEGSPGFTKREFGDPLPTFKDVMETHQTNESDLDMLERSGDYGWDWKNLTVKKGKTVKVTHKKSGKSLIIIDKPNVKREYEKIGYFAEGTVVDKKTITEASDKTGWKLYKVYDISDKLWMAMKYDLRDQFDELVKVGADYGVFQNAHGTAKILKQIKRLMDKI
jgi:hypothetical protein